MEWIIKVAVICIVVALTAVLLERDTPELALLLTLGTVVVVMAFALSFYEELGELLDSLAEQSGLSETLFLPLLKIIAISLITRLGGDICKDSGKKALASVVDIAGTFCALITARPLFEEVLSVLQQMGG